METQSKPREIDVPVICSSCGKDYTVAMKVESAADWALVQEKVNTALGVCSNCFNTVCYYDD